MSGIWFISMDNSPQLTFMSTNGLSKIVYYEINKINYEGGENGRVCDGQWWLYGS